MCFPTCSLCVILSRPLGNLSLFGPSLQECKNTPRGRIRVLQTKTATDIEIQVLPLNSWLFPHKMEVVFMLCFEPPLTVTSAARLLLWWISIMPRSPFIVVISLQLYWNWQYFHTIMVMLIDSHPPPIKKEAKIKGKNKQHLVEKLHLGFLWADLAGVLQALPQSL